MVSSGLWDYIMIIRPLSSILPILFEICNYGFVMVYDYPFWLRMLITWPGETPAHRSYGGYSNVLGQYKILLFPLFPLSQNKPRNSDGLVLTGPRIGMLNNSGDCRLPILRWQDFGAPSSRVLGNMYVRAYTGTSHRY